MLVNVFSQVITDVMLTGRQFSKLLLEPFLNNDMMFASFHSKGTAPSFNDQLNTLASGIFIFTKDYKRMEQVTC